METVTVIATQKSRKGVVKVILDKGSALDLSIPLAAEAGIHQGQTLSHSEIERLKSADTFHRSYNSALRYLGVRPRSEAEIADRLRRHGFEAGTIDKVIKKLKKQGLVDDTEFARFWQENRENFKPVGRRLVELELKQKGINPDTIAEVTSEIDDETGAYRAAQKKVRSLKGLEYPLFQKRLGDFLKRRGFDYETINSTINRVWQELEAHSQTGGKERS